MNAIIDAFDSFIKFIQVNPFYFGYFTGLAVFVVCAIIVFILFMILRTKRVSWLLMRTDRGALSISANAISDLVKSLESEFTNLDIKRVLIFKKRSSNYLEIVIRFAHGKAPLPATVSRLQKRALQILEESFGVSSISNVKVKVSGTVPDAV